MLFRCVFGKRIIYFRTMMELDAYTMLSLNFFCFSLGRIHMYLERSIAFWSYYSGFACVYHIHTTIPS